MAQWSLSVAIAFAFIPASFVSFVVRERESKVQHLQYISGVSTSAYWLSTYLWDFLNYLLPAAICILLLLAFDIQQLIGENFIGTFVVTLMFGLAVSTHLS